MTESNKFNVMGVNIKASHVINCIFYTFLKLKFLWNQCRYLQTLNSIFHLSWNSVFCGFHIQIVM